MKEFFDQIWNMPAADLGEMLETFILAILRGFGWALATFIVVGTLCYTVYSAGPFLRRRWKKYRSRRIWAGYDARKKKEEKEMGYWSLRQIRERKEKKKREEKKWIGVR